jgi:L-ascorbate metabolism protein UlaG (beta-lactamase superfamily)
MTEVMPSTSTLERLRVTYIGHATLLLELGGVRILTDPNFASSLGWVLPRVSPPGIPLDELPRLDAMLLTHAHADHLSFECLDRLPRDVPLFAPPVVARWLRRRGYSHADPLAPGERVTVGHLEITATAAKHLGSRYAVDRWRSAANMYLLDTKSTTCFFAGDTALTPDSHRLVEERVHSHGRALDVAMLPIGHAPWWKRNSFRRGHLTAEDALALFGRLGARYFIPYHWGTFHHVTSGAFDAIKQLRASLAGYERREAVRILEPGITFELTPGDP